MKKDTAISLVLFFAVCFSGAAMAGTCDDDLTQMQQQIKQYKEIITPECYAQIIPQSAKNSSECSAKGFQTTLTGTWTRGDWGDTLDCN